MAHPKGPCSTWVSYKLDVSTTTSYHQHGIISFMNVILTYKHMHPTKILYGCSLQFKYMLMIVEIEVCSRCIKPWIVSTIVILYLFPYDWKCFMAGSIHATDCRLWLSSLFTMYNQWSCPYPETFKRFSFLGCLKYL